MTPVRPLLIPGEMASGYFGRVMSINGWSKAKDALSQLTTWANCSEPLQTNVTPIKAVAMVAGCDIQTFIARHTVLPLTHELGLNALHVAETLDQPLASELVLRGGGRNCAFFCEACIEEEFNSDVAPHWRREHQIPGLNWCRTHGKLLRVIRGGTTYRNSPRHYMSSGLNWIGSRNTHETAPALTRYVEICLWLLDNAASLDAEEVSRTASARALEFGMLPVYKRFISHLLRDFLRRHFDSNWLQGSWSTVFNPGTSYGHSWDNRIISGEPCERPVVAYAVVFAAMYPSTDAAIDALLATSKRDGPDVSGSRMVA